MSPTPTHLGVRLGEAGYLGGVREALAALERGIVSASVLSAPTTLLARRMGFNEVVNIATLNLPYVHNGLVTRRSLTRQQPEQFLDGSSVGGTRPVEKL